MDHIVHGFDIHRILMDPLKLNCSQQLWIRSSVGKKTVTESR